MQELIVTNSGLYSAPNPFSSTPKGSMVTADNVVIDNNNVLESRRGFDRLSAFSNASYRASRYATYANKVLAAFGNSKLGYYTGSNWTEYTGTYSHPDATLARLRFLQAASNLYFTTNAGIYKLDNYLGEPTTAGMPSGLDITAVSTGGSGFLTNGTSTLFNGYTQIGSAVISSVPSISGLSIGQFLTGTGIPAGTTITDIIGESVSISQNATSSNLILSTTAGITTNSGQMVGLASTGGLSIGMLVSGTGIVPGTTIGAISGNTITLSVAATGSNVVLTATGTTATSTSVTTVSPTAGIQVGQFVTGNGIPAGTTVSAISGTTVTLSASATSSITGLTLTFFTSQTFNFYSNAQFTSYTGNAAAYRMLWGIKDNNKNIILGSPSGRTIVLNTGTTSVDVNVTFTIPESITTAHFFQVFRSFQSNGSSIDPGDELQLAYEGNPSGSDLVNGTITILDLTPDSLLGESLYTNASQQGIAQSNEPPPLAWDFANFRNFTFYSNTVSKNRLSVTLLSAGSPNGAQAGDVITIAGVAYTAANAENVATGNFKVFTSSTPSQNISNTAQSLVRVINQYGSTTACYAHYESGVNDLPGQILLEERGIGGMAFSVTASAHGTAYNPNLPTSGTSVESTADTFLNGLMYSKAGQPEAVPLENIFFIGSAAYRILRILPLQDSLLIFKEVEGIYRITGYDASSFVTDLLDSSARLLAPDSAVVLNNQVWGLTDQGITTVSDTGASIVSRPIEDKLLMTFGQFLDGVKEYSSGIAYETDKKYILLTVTGAADTNPTQAYVFNSFTNAFTHWPVSKTCGFVNIVDDKLYLGDALGPYTNIERKSYSFKDFVDEGISYTLSSATGTQIFLTSTNEIEVGDVLFQSDAVNSLIIDVEPAFVIVQDSLNWTAGDVTVLKGIDCLVEWVPLTVSNPGTMKQCPEVSMLFRNQQFTSAELSFASDVSPYFESVPILGNSSGRWGLFPWGEAPWGGVSVQGPIRALVPLEKQRCSELRLRFEIREGYSVFQLLGMSLPVPDDQSYFVGR